MPVLAGEVVGGGADSDRFLWDFRETKLKPTADQEFLHVGAKMPLLELLSKLNIT